MSLSENKSYDNEIYALYNCKYSSHIERILFKLYFDDAFQNFKFKPIKWQGVHCLKDADYEISKPDNDRAGSIKEGRLFAEDQNITVPPGFAVYVDDPCFDFFIIQMDKDAPLTVRACNQGDSFIFFNSEDEFTLFIETLEGDWKE